MTWLEGCALAAFTFAAFCLLMIVSSERHFRRIAVATWTCGFILIFNVLMAATS